MASDKGLDRNGIIAKLRAMRGRKAASWLEKIAEFDRQTIDQIIDEKLSGKIQASWGDIYDTLKAAGVEIRVSPKQFTATCVERSKERTRHAAEHAEPGADTEERKVDRKKPGAGRG